MANPTDFPGDIQVPGVAYLQGGIQPPLARTNLQQHDNAIYNIPLTDMTTWDAMGTPLPSAGANDDLGLVGGTFGTASPTLQTQDHKAAGSAQLNYARFQLRLPAEYVAGQTVTIRIHAGMKTTVGDQAADTVDLQVYEIDEEEGISADLCATAAISINSLVLADCDFTITATSLAPGDMLDCRIATSVDDNATGTAVIAMIGAVKLLCDVKG